MVLDKGLENTATGAGNCGTCPAEQGLPEEAGDAELLEQFQNCIGWGSVTP